MSSADVITVPCPWCEADATVMALADDAPMPPEPGAPIICENCATPMIWSAIGNPRRPFEHEWQRLNGDQRVTDLRKGIMKRDDRQVDLQVFDVGVFPDDS